MTTELPDHHPLDTRFPAMLRSDKHLNGIFNALPCPGIIEMCAYAGFDFVIIDNEHGSAGLETTENMLRAARASGIVPVVRCLPHDISRILDMGASAVKIPMVNTAAQARALVEQVRYPGLGQSAGKRGCAFSSRAAGYGAFGGSAHTQRSNEGIALIVMIETPEAVANASEIASVEGIDAVFVGPNDLAYSMGFESNWSEPKVAAAIEQALRAIAKAGKCGGTIALTAEDQKKYAALGARYFATVTTSLITRAFKQAADTGRFQDPSISY
jgi:4-hydroxy-2-oxoheptanedioate aldolase